MLKSLSIRNVALIERADLEFSDGLNVLSGETGAGKSVILDCIDFVLGAKADRNMVRYGENECLVRAEFFTEDPAVKEAMSEIDAEADDTLVISRRLSADGRGSLKLNGVPVSAAMLKKVTSLLVDVHGQSEHFFLLKEKNQLRLLDRVGGTAVAEKKSAVSALAAKRKEIVSQLERLGGDEAERARRLDILRFQIEELERADLQEGEEEKLAALREQYRNRERILQGLSEARECLLGEGGCADLLHTAARALNALGKYGAQYADFSERAENAVAEAEDLGEEVENALNGLDADEEEAQRVEARLDEIKVIKKKYGGSVSSALRFLETARQEFADLQDGGERYERLSSALETLDGELFAACEALTKARKETAVGFTERVTDELKTLNIGSAKFEIAFGGYTREDVPKATGDGLGGVEFLFSANAGEPLKPLGKIISGGEMSRFMLAVKAQTSAVSEVGTYIFDEIDAGIGGKTAKAVGEKFASIARSAQIVAVSHLARIAAFADANFLIEKHEEGTRTCTSIVPLSGEARRREIARLIGGDVGGIALQHADELLQSADSYKKSLT